MSALRAAQTAPSSSEQELISAVRRGDDRAFEELYTRYRPRIGAYVFRMVGDHQRAEDIAQEVFIAALRRLRATERPIAFKPWIYEIAKNACIDDFRRARHTKEISLEGDDEDVPVVRLTSHGADTAMEHKQRLEDLRGAFHGLSESHHRIIVMRELEGRSYSQIGETLGMTKPVVESTLFRARRKLGEEYEELVTGRRCERVQGVIAADGERPLRSLGLKERRLLARHLSHCQPCRRHARMAGVDESFFKTPSIAAKLAALLPFPLFRLRRGGERGGGSTAGPRSVAAVHSLHNAAAYVDPSGPIADLGRAAVTAAAIVAAGMGGGLVSGLDHSNAMPVPRLNHTAAPRTPAPAAQGAGSKATHAVAAPAATGPGSAGVTGSATKHKPGHGTSGGTGGGPGASSSAAPSSRLGATHTPRAANGGSGASGSTSSSTGSASGPGSLTNKAAGAGNAVHNPLSAAAGAVSKVLNGGSSSGSGSSGPSIQLPKVQIPAPKVPSNPISSITKAAFSGGSRSDGSRGINPTKIVSSPTGH